MHAILVSKLKEPRILLVLGSNPTTVAFAHRFIGECPIMGLIQQDDEYMIRDSIPNIYVPRGSINSPWVLEWMDDLKPDLIVAHGPERLKPEFINLAKYGGINVHWGLSPMYRGMHTSRWALLHKKPEWVGVTIHKLDADLDTGPIIYQARPDVEKGDTFKMVEYRLTMLACEIVPKAVGEVCNGTVKLAHQDLSIGRQYWASEWSSKYEEILTPEYITGEFEKYYREKGARNKQAPLINPWHPRN